MPRQVNTVTTSYRYPSGREFAFKTVKESEFNYIGRKRFIQSIGKELARAMADKDAERENAICCYAWDSIPDFLTAYSFEYLNHYNPNKPSSARHLYFMLSESGTLKIGIAKNVKMRQIDLRYEFDEPFEIYKVLQFQGHREKAILSDFAAYKKPVVKKSKKISQETFLWNNETKSLVDNLS